MERVSGVLSHLRAFRLQQLTALHEHVRGNVQGILSTLADGEDAVHLLITAGRAKAAASGTSVSADKPHKASVTPGKRAAAAAPGRGSKRSKASAAAAAAATVTHNPGTQAALPPVATPVRQPAATANQQAPPSRELWVKGAGSSSSPLPAPAQADDQPEVPGAPAGVALAATGAVETTAAEVLQPATASAAVNTPAQDAAACPPWSEVLHALSGGKAAGEAGAVAGAAGRSPRPSRRLPRGVSGAVSPAPLPGASMEALPAVSPLPLGGGSGSPGGAGSPEVSLCSSPAAAGSGRTPGTGAGAMADAAQGDAGAFGGLAWSLPAAQQEAASTPCLPGLKADSPPSQQWPANGDGGAALAGEVGQAAASTRLGGGEAHTDADAMGNSPLSKGLRSRASQVACSPLQLSGTLQSSGVPLQPRRTPGTGKKAGAAAAAAANPAPAARPSRGARAALRVPREPTPPSPAAPSDASGGAAATPSPGDANTAGGADADGSVPAPHVDASPAMQQQQQQEQQQQQQQGGPPTPRSSLRAARMSAVVAGGAPDAAVAPAAADAAHRQAGAEPPAAPAVAVGQAAAAKVPPPAAVAGMEQRSFGGMLNRLAAGGNNLVSGVRSLLPSAPKRPSPTIAAGKVKTKVKALEEAEVARKRELAKAEERARAKAAAAAAVHPATGARAAAGGAIAVKPPAAAAAASLAGGDGAAAAAAAASAGGEQADPSSAAHAGDTAAGQGEGGADAGAPALGSGGAQRVLVAPRVPEACRKPADREARQKRVEKEAEAARRALDRAEREERQRRAEAKRKAEEAARRAALEGRARAKEARPTKKPALGPGPGAAAAAGARAAAGGPGAGIKAGLTHKGAAGGVEGATFKSPAPKPAAHTVGGAAGGSAGSGGSGSSGFKTPGAVLKGAPREKGGISPSLAVKLLPAVVAGAEGAGAAGGVVAATPVAPEVSEQDKRNIEVLMASPYVDTTKKRTPKLPTPGQPSYDMSPYRPDDDDDTPDRSHKQVPDWARGPALRAALVAQHRTDPETVFGNLRNASCDLVQMFRGVERMVSAEALAKVKSKKRPYAERGDSENWAPDKLTWQEEVAYKRTMRYFQRPKALA